MVYFTLWKIPRWEQNRQHAYDALQKPKHQPKSVWSDLHLVKKIFLNSNPLKKSDVFSCFSASRNISCNLGSEEENYLLSVFS